ncbi:MAG: monovalent cation/H+ antiporter subunit D family protein, partial [Arenicellales bacterium]
MADASLFLIVLTPLVGALLVLLTGRSPNLRETMSILTGFALLAQVISITPEVLAGEIPHQLLATPVPGLPIALALEPLGLLFALIASSLWIVTTVYAIGYMRGHGESDQTRFFTFFAIAISATMGVALSANLITLFLFYELLTLSTYPLVTHAGTAEARRGGRVYLGIL